MPMVVRCVAFAVGRTRRRHAVRVVETEQAMTAQVVEPERIPQPVWSFGRGCQSFDLEFQPIALFEDVDTPVERQQEFECVVLRNGGARV